ncbi:MAG: nitroreductase family protein [Bacteroidales bacterium]|nr:nitroreductase family protein [Bacteroidales bacterium]
MNIIEAMNECRSVRTFNGEPLGAELRKKLMQAIDEAKSPFGGNVTIRLKEFDLKGEYRPSTYGSIKGATDFFLLGLQETKESALTAGFRFEQVVLRAWELGLGCCWIAATFKGSDFDRGQTWPDGEQLRIICPVGVAAAKKGFLESITRLALGSKNRKKFEDMFFTDNFAKPYSRDGQFGEALEMMRLAPSSKNSQPWRALVTGNRVDFYFRYNNPASVLDCGIGLCHFWETENFYDRKGSFTPETDAPVALDNWQYLVSYRI